MSRIKGVGKAPELRMKITAQEEYGLRCLTRLARADNQTATLEMPFWLFMGPLALGSLLLIVETAAMFIHTLRRGRPEAKQTVLT
jgi:hypothetical protein